jgi:hypothetical protein
MYRGKGQESWFSTKKTSFIERYSFSSKNLFSLTASGTRIIPFLYLRWEDSTIFLNNKLFLSCTLALSQKRFHAVADSDSVLVLLVFFSIRAWG